MVMETKRVSQHHMSSHYPVNMLVSRPCSSMGFRSIMIHVFEWQTIVTVQMSKWVQFRTFHHVSLEHDGEVKPPVNYIFEDDLLEFWMSVYLRTVTGQWSRCHRDSGIGSETVVRVRV